MVSVPGMPESFEAGALLSYALLALLSLTLLAAAAFALFGLLSRRRFLPCPLWLRWLVELDNPFTRINRAKNIIETLALKPGMSLLDLGCGPGRLTIPAAQALGPSGRVVAVDVQDGMLSLLSEKAAKAGLSNIQLVKASLGEDARLESNAFDRALLVTALGEIAEPEAALKEIFEALKPGGVLSVTEVIFDPHFQFRKTVSRLALSAGFREKAFFGSSLSYTMHFEKP